MAEIGWAILHCFSYLKFLVYLLGCYLQFYSCCVKYFKIWMSPSHNNLLIQVNPFSICFLFCSIPTGFSVTRYLIKLKHNYSHTPVNRTSGYRTDLISGPLIIRTKRTNTHICSCRDSISGQMKCPDNVFDSLSAVQLSGYGCNVLRTINRG